MVHRHYEDRVPPCKAHIHVESGNLKRACGWYNMTRQLVQYHILLRNNVAMGYKKLSNGMLAMTTAATKASCFKRTAGQNKIEVYTCIQWLGERHSVVNVVHRCFPDSILSVFFWEPLQVRLQLGSACMRKGYSDLSGHVLSVHRII